MKKQAFLIWSLLVIYAPLSLALDLDAQLDWSARNELSVLGRGMVKTINVQPGQQVKKGDLLLAMDEREFIALIQQAKAAVTRAQERFDEAIREFDRSEELYDRQVLSDHGRQLVIIEKVESEALLQEAKAALLIARLNQERSRIVAPYDGVVIAVDVTKGAVVEHQLTAAPLLTIANNQQMHAEALVDGQQAASIKPGTLVQVAVRETWLDGKVQQIALEPAEQTERGPLYRLTVAFSPNAMLRMGEKAVIRLAE